jgi:prepilin-type N-terminal cleavage/methylation domain-containing protein
MRGFTMVEMIVVLALLGLMVGISGLAVWSLRPPDAPGDGLRKLRAEAILSGVPRSDSGVLFLPDGRAVGISVDPLTGAANAQ